MAGRKIDLMHNAYGKYVYRCRDCCHYVGKTCLAYGDSAKWNGDWLACRLFNEPLKGLAPMTYRGKKELDEQLDGQIRMEELL